MLSKSLICPQFTTSQLHCSHAVRGGQQVPRCSALFSRRRYLHHSAGGLDYWTECRNIYSQRIANRTVMADLCITANACPRVKSDCVRHPIICPRPARNGVGGSGRSNARGAQRHPLDPRASAAENCRPSDSRMCRVRSWSLCLMR